MASLPQKGVGVFELAETNFPWTPTATRTCANRARKALYQQKGKKINLSLQAIVCAGWAGGQHQPGGTCTCAIDWWTSRVNSKEEGPERMGRWSTLMIQAKGDVITFIAAYRLCKTSVILKAHHILPTRESMGNANRKEGRPEG